MRWVKLEASHRKTTVSNLIRDAVGHLVKERRRVDWENDSITRLVRDVESGKMAGALRAGVSDGAEEHDHYLYGAPKGRRWKK